MKLYLVTVANRFGRSNARVEGVVEFPANLHGQKFLYYEKDGETILAIGTDDGHHMENHNGLVKYRIVDARDRPIGVGVLPGVNPVAFPLDWKSIGFNFTTPPAVQEIIRPYLPNI